jgi:N-glycosidase YbiA
MTQIINFYGHAKENPTGFLSNFYAHRITIDGIVWYTTEHYFQAQKFKDDPVYQEKIRTDKSPYNAKSLGSTRSIPIDPDWEKNKEGVMLKALQAKFSDPVLKKKLMDTGYSVLIEHTDRDSYWGDGGNGSGKNRLGYLLMVVREKFFDEEYEKRQVILRKKFEDKVSELLKTYDEVNVHFSFLLPEGTNQLHRKYDKKLTDEELFCMDYLKNPLKFNYKEETEMYTIYLKIKPSHTFDPSYHVEQFCSFKLKDLLK